MTKVADESPARRGRKAEGRTAKMIRMGPEAWTALDERLRGRSDTRGRVIERMLANPALQPETETQDENRMQKTMTIDATNYYIQLEDPLARRGGEPEPWIAAANSRVQTAAECIGLEVLDWDQVHESEWDDPSLPFKIDWAEHAIGKGLRYNTRQWEMWMQRELVAAAKRNAVS